MSMRILSISDTYDILDTEMKSRFFRALTETSAVGTSTV